MSEEFREIRFTLNGTPAAARVPVRRSLVDALRQDFGHTGSHVGCEHGICGACSVVLDGLVVRGCLVLAVAAEGAAVETIEGASDSGRLARLQQAFYERAALQCGFCTPGMLLSAAELLERNPHPSRAEIRHYLSGNYCRCTGYEAIVDAVEAAARG
jgi:aerobic-type carbon monoxide dehydrogenase small subunit (CoxS/CutS family)